MKPPRGGTSLGFVFQTLLSGSKPTHDMYMGWNRNQPRSWRARTWTNITIVVRFVRQMFE